MSLPPISPTGALASGDYVDYMIGYLNTAMDSEAEQLTHYLGAETCDGWEAQWNRTITDLNEDLVDIAKSVNKLKIQTTVAKDAIAKI